MKSIAGFAFMTVVCCAIVIAAAPTDQGEEPMAKLERRQDLYGGGGGYGYGGGWGGSWL